VSQRRSARSEQYSYVVELLIVTGPAGVGKSEVSGRVALTAERSVHLRIDAFMRSIVNGWIDPWLAEAGQQNEAIGGAVFAAAMEFAAAGYTVIVDGCIFHSSLDRLARACRHRSVPLSYAVLRCDLDTCCERAARRDGEIPDRGLAAALHARFEDLGAYERHVVDAAGTRDEVTAALVSAFEAGMLRVA